MTKFKTTKQIVEISLKGFDFNNQRGREEMKKYYDKQWISKEDHEKEIERSFHKGYEKGFKEGWTE